MGAAWDHVVNNAGIRDFHIQVDATRPKTGGVRTTWTPINELTPFKVTDFAQIENPYI